MKANRCNAFCAGWILSLLCLPCVINAAEFHAAVNGAIQIPEPLKLRFARSAVGFIRKHKD